MKGNAIKSFLVLALNLVAFAVFIRHGQVDWLMGGILAVGQVAGAWAAARMAVQPAAQRWVYRLLLVVVVVSAVQIFLG